MPLKKKCKKSHGFSEFAQMQAEVKSSKETNAQHSLFFVVAESQISFPLSRAAHKIWGKV